MLALVLLSLFGRSDAQGFNVDTTNIDDFGLWHAPVQRPWHLIGVYDPNQDPEEQRQVYESRQKFTVDQFNQAMAFHQVPIRLKVGDIHMKNSNFWDATQEGCAASLDICKGWTADLGRAEGELDWYMCILPDSYLPDCNGMGDKPGSVGIVSERGFRNPKKIGALYELGHNLGCEYQGEFCSDGADTLMEATGNYYLTVMGGGSACSEIGSKIRLPYYTDAREFYCESNQCITLGNDKFDCAKDMIVELNHWISTRKPPKCPDTSFQGACLVKEQKTCRRVNKLGVFSNVGQCAGYVRDNPEKCPSQKFSWSMKRQDLACRCCEEGDEKTSDHWDLYKPTELARQLDVGSDYNERGVVLESAKPFMEEESQTTSNRVAITYGAAAATGFLISVGLMSCLNMYRNRKDVQVEEGVYTRQV